MGSPDWMPCEDDKGLDKYVKHRATDGKVAMRSGLKGEQGMGVVIQLTLGKLSRVPSHSSTFPTYTHIHPPQLAPLQSTAQRNVKATLRLLRDS